MGEDYDDPFNAPIDEAEYWRSADGRRIRITKMGEQHLKNAIAYLVKRGCESARLVRYTFDATDVDRAEATMLPVRNKLLLQYTNMLKEQERRDALAKVPAPDEPECDAG